MLKQSGLPQMESNKRRRNCHLLMLIGISCLLATPTSADEEVVSTQPRVLFKNEEFLNRKQIPDLQSILQKPLTDKKFENLNTFLVVLQSTLTEAGFKSSPGECV